MWERFSWQWWVFGNLALNEIDFQTYMSQCLLFLCFLVLSAIIIDNVLKGGDKVKCKGCGKEVDEKDLDRNGYCWDCDEHKNCDD